MRWPGIPRGIWRRLLSPGVVLRPVLLLLAGGALAQALPLLLGPWLTRLYTPAQFGTFHLFAAVAANLGVPIEPPMAKPSKGSEVR